MAAPIPFNPPFPLPSFNQAPLPPINGAPFNYLQGPSQAFAPAFRYPFEAGPALPEAGASGLSRFLPSFLRGGASGAGEEILPLGIKGSLRAAVPYLGAGQLGGYAIRKLSPGSSKAEQIASGAAQGAGLGAGIGAVGGLGLGDWLTIPVGTAIGGVVGGLAGLIRGGKKGTQEVSPIDSLRNTMAQTGLSPEEQHQYIKYYSLLNSVGGDTKASRAQSASAINQVILKEYLQNQGQGQTAGSPYSVKEQAALQAQTAAFLAPYTQQTIDSAKAASDYTMSHLSNVPEQYRGVLAAGAQRQLAASTRLANAYAAQALLSPQATAIQSQQRQQSALAAQLMQQALAAQLSGQSSGAGTDIAALISGSQGYQGP